MAPDDFWELTFEQYNALRVRHREDERRQEFLYAQQVYYTIAAASTGKLDSSIDIQNFMPTLRGRRLREPIAERQATPEEIERNAAVWRDFFIAASRRLGEEPTIIPRET